MEIDATSDFGRRALNHLEQDQIVWLTTVDSENQPQPNPIWFVWDGHTFLFYSKPDAKRLSHIQHNTSVSLHFDTDYWGDDVLIISGQAAMDPAAPKVIDNDTYLEKYQAGINHINMTSKEYSQIFSVPFRVRPERIRGYYVPPGETPTI